MDKNTMTNNLDNMVKCLSKRHIAVLAGYYYDGKTQSEISKDLNITRARISQLMSESKQLLKDAGLPIPEKLPKKRLCFYSNDDMDDLVSSSAGHRWVKGNGKASE